MQPGRVPHQGDVGELRASAINRVASADSTMIAPLVETEYF